MATLPSNWMQSLQVGMQRMMDPEKTKTFRPKSKLKAGSRLERIHTLAQRTLGTGSLREAVTLPPGESLNEWLAVKTLDLFNETNLVYGFVSEFCTQSSCPIMCAALPNGSICHYAWADERIKQPVQLSACDYVSHLFGWVQRQLDSEDIFPTEPSRPFPADFRSIVSQIFRRLFRVYAHAYHNHYERMVALSFLPHINTCFKVFARPRPSTPTPTRHRAGTAALRPTAHSPPPSAAARSTLCTLCSSSTSSRARRNSRRCSSS